MPLGPELHSALGRFEVLREVGRGAAGIVFQARDQLTGADVALKVIAAPDVAPETRDRFLGEGQVLTGLDHPGIVRIVDFGTLGDLASGATFVEFAGIRVAADAPFVAMEWLDGSDLAHRQAREPLRIPQLLSCMTQVAGALGAAHSAGVVHRDVKPSNLFVVRGDGEIPLIKLLDFGVATSELHGLTGVAFAGTPAYMAPEQARGDLTLDPRCDVYSLGATLFELLAGRTPHVGATAIAILAKVVSTPAQRLSETVGGVPEPLDELVSEMLALEWKQRPAARDVERRLMHIAADPKLPGALRVLDRDAHGAHSSVSRLITTLVALQLPSLAARDEQIEKLRAVGAEAVRLGKDSIVAYLGARQARGGEAATALELGRGLMALGAQVGVASGRARVGLARPDGAVVDQASALARRAGAGRLLADETTAELARASFEFSDAPSLQGSSVELVGPATEARRARVVASPFVGRDAEVAAISRAYSRFLDSRQPVVVSVSGPPGIGKSRLGREVVLAFDRMHADPAPLTHPSFGIVGPDPRVVGGTGARVFRAQCESYGRSRALGLAATALTDFLGVAAGTNSKVLQALLDAHSLVHDTDRLLATFLAGEPLPAELEPNRARDVLYLAMTELALHAIGDTPCVLVLEDVQWSDPESIAWFEHLLSRAAGSPLFMLVMTRPSFWRDHPSAFRGRDHVRLELRPIAKKAALEIARAITGREPGDADLEQIAKQAAGSPLFAEELARVMAAGKSLTNVPTIEAAIQVSLDGLEVELRSALTRMSALGPAVWDDAVLALGVDDARKIIDRLVRAEFLTEQSTTRFPRKRELWFKHALVREVAYAALTEDLKKELHGYAARWLAENNEYAATVAQHFDLAGAHEAAAEFWERAARLALAASALPDAARMADRALAFAKDKVTSFARARLLEEVYSRLDERSSDRADAICAMEFNVYDDASEVRTFGAVARYDHARSVGVDIEERLFEAMTRAAELELHDEEASCGAMLATRFAFSGDLDRAEAVAERLVGMATAPQMEAAAIDGWQVLAVVHQSHGRLAEALDARRQATQAARNAGLKNREAMLTINLGFALTTIGARAEARRLIVEGTDMAEQVGSVGTVRLGRMIKLGWSAYFGADASFEAELQETRQLADEASTGGWASQDRVTLGVLFYRGCELLQFGADQLPRARQLLRMAADAYRATDNRDVLPVACGFLAEAERRMGEHETAERIAREAAELVEAGAPSLLNESIIYVALHGARIDLGDFTGAQQAIERAMPALLRRYHGLANTPYVRGFLGLSYNALLVAAADSLGVLPDELAPYVD
ncbi:MAG: serine/threonine-protein kinase PknK [Myxococcales bacterium]|nr:serine/threonine-protein kinase PknK [Myxococcales bacterium]